MVCKYTSLTANQEYSIENPGRTNPFLRLSKTFAKIQGRTPESNNSHNKFPRFYKSPVSGNHHKTIPL